MKKHMSISVIGTLFLLLNLIVPSSSFSASSQTDFDPLVDISVTVELKMIRYLAVNELQTFPVNKGNESPNFYVKVLINDEEFTSPVWNDMKYITDPNWNATLNVPDEVEIVTITLQLWSDETEDVLYDLCGDLSRNDVVLLYSIKTGYWTGDDSLHDVSGYGRLNGCDDGTIYGDNLDCELWFDIWQTDADGDHIPYWIETETLGTDPTIDDRALDPDNDTIPSYWEYKWGYQPLVWEDHEHIDPENDSINNIEEYLTSQWYSDPYRKDVFLEMDIMGDGPNGEKTYFPENSKELALTAFDKQNIMIHLDSGQMGEQDIIPFVETLGWGDMDAIYLNYFLHGDPTNWRKGIFHYGVVLYDVGIAGFTFQSDAFQISSSKVENIANKPIVQRDIAYASCYIHELGHTFGFWPIPGHNRFSAYPWQLGWWWAHSYRSCMNYGWTYLIVDYSDGSRRFPDRNDWDRINYPYFENGWG